MPLRILVHPSLYTLEVFQALKDQGHVVDIEMSSTPPVSPDGSVPSVWEYDGIFGPNCWRMNETLAKHVPLALKSLRAVKYVGRVSNRKKREGSDRVLSTNP